MRSACCACSAWEADHGARNERCAPAPEEEEVLPCGSRLFRWPVEALADRQERGGARLAVRLPGSEAAEAAVPAAVDRAYQRGGPRPRHQLQPLHGGAAPGGRRG